MNTLLTELDTLHEHYVDAVNRAVGADDLTLVQEMEQAYEADVLHLVAVDKDRRDAA